VLTSRPWEIAKPDVNYRVNWGGFAEHYVDDAGHDLGPGGTGEILVGATRSGPWAGVYTPMLGYLGRPEATAAAVVVLEG